MAIATSELDPRWTEGLLPPPDVDFERLGDYRLGRIRHELANRGIAAAVLNDPISLQYAIDFDEYQLYQTRIATFSALIPGEGSVKLHGAYNRGYPLVDEYADCLNLTTFDGGLDLTDRARRYAEELRRQFGRYARIAIERPDVVLVRALEEQGLEVIDARPCVDKARSIKSDDEVGLIKHAIAVAGLGIRAMRNALVPGARETELIGILSAVNLAHGGRWLDGRMLASGPRSNPWLQEASRRAIQAGDIVAFDTDMVGPHGYFADVSRAMICGDRAPTPAQHDLLRWAVEEVEHNIELLRPGAGFREITERSFAPPKEFIAHRYACLMHGAGMGDEWPKLPHRQDWGRNGYDGQIEAGMVICVESFIGSDRGGEGVKLEQQVLVTEAGNIVLSDVPTSFEEVGR